MSWSSWVIAFSFPPSLYRAGRRGLTLGHIDRTYPVPTILAGALHDSSRWSCGPGFPIHVHALQLRLELSEAGAAPEHRACDLWLLIGSRTAIREIE